MPSPRLFQSSLFEHLKTLPGDWESWLVFADPPPSRRDPFPASSSEDARLTLPRVLAAMLDNKPTLLLALDDFEAHS